MGSPILWQHLFWFFGHPEVYILVLPYFGIITEILPVFSRRPVFGYAGLVFATIAIAALSVGVWAHHMFVTGAVLLPFFTAFSMLIAVPTGVKFFNWIGTMWGGSLVFPTPMLFALGFLFTFLLGGLTGVMLAAAPIDFHVSDSYFVVAHMHYVLFGGSVFALYAGIYYWWPKVTGRLLDERWGKVHFWMTLVGFHLTFLVQHVLGLDGMPRRVADYFDSDGFTGLNQISTIGAFLLGGVDAAVPVERRADPAGTHGHAGAGQPVGWPDARVGHGVAAPARELHRAAAPHPLAAAGVGPRPPRAHLGGPRERHVVSEGPSPAPRAPRVTSCDPPVDDRKVPWRVFLGIGLFVLVIGAIYWATAYEESGTVMLLLAGALSLWIGAYLWLRTRAEPGPEAAAAESAAERAAEAGEALPGHGVAEEGEHYLPHASAWPFAIGLGAATLANGLVLGLWVIVPGAALMALGIGGFVRQTRRRD